MNHVYPKHIFYLTLLGAALSNAVAAAENKSNGPDFYGRINISVEQQNLDGANNTIQGKAPVAKDQWELNSNSSRIGVNGSYELDGGLTAIYQAEYEINYDDGGGGETAFNQRNTFAGLRGGFGEIRAGKFDTPLKVAEEKIDQFNDLRGDIDYLIGGQNRANNIVQYTSPRFANTITLNAAVIPAEGDDVDQDAHGDSGLADTYSLSAVFDNKTFYGAVAYEENQFARRSLDGINRADLLRIVGGWKTPSFELGALAQIARDNLDNSDKEDTDYFISGAYKAGKFKYKVQYGTGKGEASDETGRLTALGIDYALGAASAVYIYWAALDLNEADLTDRVYGIGLTHSFTTAR